MCSNASPWRSQRKIPRFRGRGPDVDGTSIASVTTDDIEVIVDIEFQDAHSLAGKLATGLLI